MSTEVLQNKLIVLTQFVLSKVTQDTRNELHEHIVRGALSYQLEDASFKGAKTFDEIASAIREVFGFDPPPPAVLHNAIDRLVDRQEILPAFVERAPKDIAYRLSQDKLKEIAQVTLNYNKIRERFEQSVVKLLEDEYAGQIPDDSKKLALDNLYHFLGDLFNTYGQLCVDLLVCRKRDSWSIWDDIRPSRCLERAIASTEDEQLKNAQNAAFRKIFGSLDKEGRLYLMALTQTYMLAEILCCDPYCQTLVRTEFARKETFLDTNILVAAVCGQDVFHETALDLLDTMKSLDVKPKYTRQTLAELRSFIENARRNYMRYMMYPSLIASQIVDLIDDPFVQEYRTATNMTWDEYCEEVEKRLTEYMSKSFHVELDERDHEKYRIEESPGFNSCVQEIRAAAQQEKSLRLAAHDAYHLFLIRELRKELEKDVPATGSDFWFLTLDKQLFNVDVQRMQLQKGSRPASVILAVWIQMLWPFLAPEVAHVQAPMLFAEVFRSSFPESSFRINPAKLFSLVDKWIIERGTSVLDAKYLAGRTFVRDYVLSELGM